MIHENFGINKSRFYNFFTWESLKIFNITSKHFSILKNKPPGSWVAHIIRDFLTLFLFVISLVPWLKFRYSGKNGKALESSSNQKLRRFL